MAGTNLPGGGSSGYTIAGVTTLLWGTDGLLKSPAPSSGSFAGTGFYIVESVDPSVKSEPIWGENGTGVEVWRVILLHGGRANIVVQDDTQMTPPQIGQTLVLNDSGLCIPGNSVRTNSYQMVVLNSSVRFVRKGAEMRTLEVENLTLVDSQVTQ